MNMKKVKAVHIPPVKCLPVETLTWQEWMRQWMRQLTPEELACGRILRGHKRQGCKCRFCKRPRTLLPSADSFTNAQKTHFGGYL